MTSFWSKRINTNAKHEVAKELGVDVEKVQELIDGKIHIGGGTMDKVLQTIENEKESRVARELEIRDWYKRTDLKALRKEWGYSQGGFAKIININPATYSAIENHYIKGVSKNVKAVYYFYNSEANEPKEIETTTRVDEEILEWYKDADLKDLRKAFGYSLMDLANRLEINYKTLNNIESHGYDYQKPSRTLVKLYQFYKNENNKNKNESPDDIFIKIDSDGNITYMENGQVVANVTEIHLDKVGNEKPNLEIKLKRIF